MAGKCPTSEEIDPEFPIIYMTGAKADPMALARGVPNSILYGKSRSLRLRLVTAVSEPQWRAASILKPAGLHRGAAATYARISA